MVRRREKAARGKGWGAALLAMLTAGSVGTLSCGSSSSGGGSGLDALQAAMVDSTNIRTAVRAGIFDSFGRFFSKNVVQPQVGDRVYVPGDFSIFWTVSQWNCLPQNFQPPAGCPTWSVTGSFPQGATVTQNAGTLNNIQPPFNFTVSINAPGGGCSRTLYPEDLSGKCISNGKTGTISGSETDTVQATALTQGTTSSSINERVDYPDRNWVTLTGSSNSSLSGGTYSSSSNSQTQFSNGRSSKSSSTYSLSPGAAGSYNWSYNTSDESDTSRNYFVANVTISTLATDANYNPTKIQINGTVTVGSNSDPDGKITLSLSNVILDRSCGQGIQLNGGTIQVSGNGSATLTLATDCSSNATVTVNGLAQDGQLSLN